MNKEAIKMVREIKIQSIEDISSYIPKLPVIDDIHTQFASYLGQMQDESTRWLEYSETVEHIINKYFTQKIIEAGASISSGTSCSATGTSLTRDNITYTRSRYAIRAPSISAPMTTYKIDQNGKTLQGNLIEVGRMGGLGGWSLDGDMIIASLASYTHNFVAMMLAFFKRATLPLKIPIELPNLVLAETRTPSQFVPPLSMMYKLPPLTPLMMSTIKISAPVESSAFVVQRNISTKETFAKTKPFEITPGTSSINILTKLYPGECTGIFDIEPHNAPSGLKIESIKVFPPTLQI